MKKRLRKRGDTQAAESVRRIKVCFAASSGGHLEQLLKLRPLMDKYNGFVVTENPGYDLNLGVKTHYLHQVNRNELLCIPKMLGNSLRSLGILVMERPDAVVCTGVLACIPLCLLAKAGGAKLVYIESFAKLNSPTRTGKLLCKYTDRLYVQWKSMLNVYPDAIFVGGVH